jgi:hypothetical protein
MGHLRGRPPGLAGGMSGASIFHSWSERSLGQRQRDENIMGLQKAGCVADRAPLSTFSHSF